MLITAGETANGNWDGLGDDLLTLFFLPLRDAEIWADRSALQAAACVCTNWQRVVALLLPAAAVWSPHPERDFLCSPSHLLLVGPSDGFVRCHIVRERRPFAPVRYTLFADDAGGSSAKPRLGQPLLSASCSGGRVRITAGCSVLLAALSCDVLGRKFELSSAASWSGAAESAPLGLDCLAAVTKRFGSPCGVSAVLRNGELVKSKPPVWQDLLRYW